MEKQTVVYDLDSVRRLLRGETPLDTVFVHGRIFGRNVGGVHEQDDSREFPAVRYWICGHALFVSRLGFFTGS